MSTSKLKIYNSALTICGERHLASLTEDRKSRRLLDHVWDNDGIETCLEYGQWKFATKAVKFDYDTSITTDFGYARGFSKPTDWVVTSAVCTDEYFSAPLIRYSDENSYWYADLDEIYVKYVSNASDFGRDLSLWPATFEKFVSAFFASEIIWALTQDDAKVDRAEMKLDKARSKAKNSDAMAGPQQFPAPGTFVGSRYRSRGTRDRGNRNSLIG